MPGRNMADGRTPNLYDNFSAVAQRLGTYSAHDYAQIIDHLVKVWRIADLSVSGKAARAQDYLCQQAERYERFADEMADNLTAQPPCRSPGSSRPTPARSRPERRAGTAESVSRACPGCSVPRCSQADQGFAGSLAGWRSAQALRYLLAFGLTSSQRGSVGSLAIVSRARPTARSTRAMLA